MSDASVAEALRSTAQLVVVEAPGGCGKTYQGANYARDIAPTLGDGRLLVLTHTNAACDVFATKTRNLGRCVEIRTIDGLITEIASAYHKALELPADVGAWARRDTGNYNVLAQKAAALIAANPMIASTLARRYPVVICDEHQDASLSQHAIIMALHAAGTRLRVFADPMQQIFNGNQAEEVAAAQRWADLKAAADRFEELDQPHRWANTQPALGAWILDARETLKEAGRIDLTANLPAGLTVHYADNTAQQHGSFSVHQDFSAPIYARSNAQGQLLVLSGRNRTVTALRTFFGRRIPIWEGHVRNGLTRLIAHTNTHQGNATELARGTVAFMRVVATGFSASAFGNRFIAEAHNGCAANCTGKPLLLQSMARHLVDDPSHKGVARAIARLQELVANEQAFSEVRVHHPREFAEAIQLSGYDNADDGLAEMARRRSHSRPKLPRKAISTIHKAKGLEFDNVMLLPCDQSSFGNTARARAKLYVALSRATSRLMLVVSKGQPSPLFKIEA